MKPVLQIHSSDCLWSRSSEALAEHDIWFDAIDYVEMDDTWFDAEESDISKEKAEELIPFTEDCVRCIKQLILYLGDIKQNELIAFGLSNAFPNIPVNIILAADALYTAIIEKRHIDSAVLHSLWVTSSYLLPDGNAIFQLAYFIKDIFLSYIDGSFVEQFLIQNDHHYCEYVPMALAVLAVATKYCLGESKAPQRVIFKIPTFLGHLMIRASRYWNILCDLAQHATILTETKSHPAAFEIDICIDMAWHPENYLFKNKVHHFKHTLIKQATSNNNPTITHFSSNSTSCPEFFIKATVPNKPIKKANENANTVDKLHAFAIDALKQKSEIQALQYCVTKKTETHQRNNKSLITQVHMNTKCDALSSQSNKSHALSIVTPDNIETSKSVTVEKRINTGLPYPSSENSFTLQIKEVWEKAHYLYGRLLSRIHPYDFMRFPSVFSVPLDDLNMLTVIPLETSSLSHLLRHKGKNHGRGHWLTTSSINTKANLKIIHIMRARGLLDDTRAIRDYSKEEFIISVSSYLYSPLSNTMPSKPERFKEIARYILHENHVYGGREGEEISPLMVESVVRNWIFHTILETSFNHYITKKMENYLSYYTIDTMLQMFSFQRLHENKKLNVENIHREKWKNFNLMWFSCLQNEIPFLNFIYDEIKNVPLDSQEFAYLYTGSRFLSHTVTLNNLSRIDVMHVGEAMWNIAINEELEIDKTSYFLLPALFFVAKEHEEISSYDNAPEIINKYIKYQKNIQLTRLMQSVQHDVNNKLEKYKAAVRLWSNKEKLAEKIISTCLQWELPSLPDQADPIRLPEQRYEKAKQTAKQFYMNNFMKPCKRAPDSLHGEYIRLTENVAKSFSDIDTYLIWSAFETLEQEDSIFILSPDAVFHPVNFNVKYPRPVPFMSSAGIFENPIYELDKVDIFSVILGDEERYYCLKGDFKDLNNAYKFMRINYSNVYELIKSGHDFHEKIKFNHHIHHNPHAITMYGFDYFVYYNRTLSKQYRPEENKNFYSLVTDKNTIISKGNVNELVNYLTKIHQDIFSHSLYEAGNDLSDIEKIWIVVKHMIPFYDCVGSIINKEVEQAITTCLIDVILTVSTMLGGKFSFALLKRSYKWGTAILEKQITLGSIRDALSIKRLPSVQEMATLNKNTFYAINSGIEFITSIDVRFSKKIIDYMIKNNKISANIMSKIVSSRLTAMNAISPNHYILKRLSHSNVYVPVKIIGKRQQHDIYVRINPNTGEMFGKYYILSKNNILIEYNKFRDLPLEDELKYSINKQFCTKSFRIRKSPCFYNTNLNEKSILEQTGFQTDLYRADKLSFEEIKSLGGFPASKDFSAIEKMIEGDNALIVSEDLTGVLRYLNSQNEHYHIYKIAPHNIRGASLNTNIEMNSNGIKKFLNVQAENNIDWIYETNGANTLYEAHVHLQDITLEKISYIGTNVDNNIKDLIKKLKIGRWSAYF